MRAVLYEAFGQRPSVETVPDPEPAPDGVVIEVRATGVCRSDWHGWMGHDPDIALPHVPGHELAGVVAEVGPRVTGWRVGDRVTVPFVSGCGVCQECRSGNQQVCADQFQPGFTAWGSFAEHVAIPRADLNLVGIPDEMDAATAASLGCRFATAFRAVIDQGRVRGGEWVAVHGCGGVGLSAVMIAAAHGARVVAVDISDDALSLARQLGAEEVVNAASVADVPDAITDVTDGGAHLSLDALGNPVTCVNSVRSLRTRGRHVQVGLLLASQSTPPIPMDAVVAAELEILGSHGMPAHRYDAMLGMITAGTLRPDQLIGARIGLDESVDALVAMDDFRGVGATVITRF